jgi:hypothetical protein
MNNPREQVEDRWLELAFDELSGREAPPDRVEQIVRCAVDGVGARRRQHASRLWAAALVLIGLTVTVVAGVFFRGRGVPDEAGTAPAVVPEVAVADVVPEPKTEPEQSPEQSPELPKGTDPADLAAMRSADAMLAAERKLAAQLKAGKIGGVDEVLGFDRLNDWEYTKGLEGMPADVRALDGSKVLMLGFMLPIDEVEHMREFLLVASLWSCCYGTPPNVHGIVRCVMPADRAVDYMFDPVKVVGRLTVSETTQDGYCVDVYQLHVEFLEAIE